MATEPTRSVGWAGPPSKIPIKFPPPLPIAETEGLRAGFWGKPSPDFQTVVEACRGKLFLNFDDDAFGPGPRRFLDEHFPNPCRYERAQQTPRYPRA